MRRRCSGPLQVRRSNGQLADALACRGVDRIAKRWRDWGYAGLTDAARRRLAPYDMHVCLRRDVHARHQIIGEVTLLDPPLTDRYVTIKRVAEAHDCGPLHLCAHSIGIHGQAAIDGHIDAWNRNLSVIGDGDLDHRRGIGNEAAVDGDAAAVTRWQRLPPPSVLRGKIKRGAQPSGIDRIKLDRGAIVWVIDALRLEIDLPCWPNELAQIIERISPGQGRHFVCERADREGVRDVEYRSIPADAHMGGRRTVLAAHVRDRTGHVANALLEFAGAPHSDVRLESRLDRRKNRPM